MTRAIYFKATDGRTLAVEAIDTGVSDNKGNNIFKLGVDSAVTIDPGDITLAGVVIQDAGSSIQAKVAAATGVAEGDYALAVQASILGQLSDSVDLAGGATTINAKLRGLIQLFAARIPTLGQKTMAASLPVVMASNQPALAVSGNLGRTATEVTPAAQATTNAFASITASVLDTLNNETACYTLVNTGAASLTWQVLAANFVDFSDSVVINGPTVVAAAGISSYVAAPAPFRYYKIQVKSTVADTPGEATTHGITKG